MQSTLPAYATYRLLVDDELYRRLVNRIARDEELSVEDAERIMDSALGFLKLCADHPTHTFSPTPSVDIGWHTFILYTRPYAEFCERQCGRFIHHEPTDADDDESNMTDAAEFMRLHDIDFDEELWLSHAAGCKGCQACKQCNCRP
jgi:hypothetical protein